MFEDVHFDFDRFNLRPDALKILDDAVAKLQANPGLNVTIEGHCDSIGTVEYNLALGERRVQLGPRLPRQPRDRGGPAADGELRRRASDCRQQHRRGTRDESPRAPGGRSSSNSARIGQRAKVTV